MIIKQYLFLFLLTPHLYASDFHSDFKDIKAKVFEYDLSDKAQRYQLEDEFMSLEKKYNSSMDHSQKLAVKKWYNYSKLSARFQSCFKKHPGGEKKGNELLMLIQGLSLPENDECQITIDQSLGNPAEFINDAVQKSRLENLESLLLDSADKAIKSNNKKMSDEVYKRDKWNEQSYEALTKKMVVELNSLHNSVVNRFYTDRQQATDAYEYYIKKYNDFKSSTTGLLLNTSEFSNLVIPNADIIEEGDFFRLKVGDRNEDFADTFSQRVNIENVHKAFNEFTRLMNRKLDQINKMDERLKYDKVSPSISNEDYVANRRAAIKELLKTNQVPAAQILLNHPEYVDIYCGLLKELSEENEEKSDVWGYVADGAVIGGGIILSFVFPPAGIVVLSGIALAETASTINKMNEQQKEMALFRASQLSGTTTMDISIENQAELQEKIDQSLNSLWISGALSLTGPLAKLSKVGINEGFFTPINSSKNSDSFLARLILTR